MTMSRGPINIALTEREGGGWDITSLTFNGLNVLKDRKGEFETDKEAEAAALAKAEAFARARGYLK
jgi:hypothetical protein